MPYIGKSPIGGGFHKLDNLTASATATYALTLGSAAYYPETANQLLVSLNGVIQAPQDSFTVSGSNLIFDTALTASDSIDFVVALGDVLGVQGVTDGAVTTNKIANQAVTMNKLATSGTLPALDGSNLTGVGVAGISSSSTSGTALSIDANNLVFPKVPVFEVIKTTNQTLSSGSWSKITFDSESYDTASFYDLANSKFQPTIAGYYHINLCLFFGNGTNTAALSYLYKNGAIHRQIASLYHSSQSLDDYGIAGGALVYMNGTTDYIEAYSYIVGTARVVNGNASGESSIMSGHLVSAA
jgi:hypothetical protein